MSRAFATGRTFSSRTLTAGWAARRYHTSVVDAAGAIYVIGGYGTTRYNDVWASTDGGARAGLGRGVHWVGTLGGYYGGYYGGTNGVLRGTKGVLQGVLQGYYRGYSGVLGANWRVLGGY